MGTTDPKGEPDAATGLFHPHSSRGEWVEMWATGIDPATIATRCGVDIRRVERAIRAAVKDNPDLEQRFRRERPGRLPRQRLNDHPKLPTTFLGRYSYTEVIDLYVAHVDEHGQPPSQLAADPIERALYRWMADQRHRLKAGTLDTEQATALTAALKELPGLSAGASRAERFARHLKVAVQIVRAEGRLPMKSRTGSSAERKTAVWLHQRRALYRQGRLPDHEVEQLNTHLPGWDVPPRR